MLDVLPHGTDESRLFEDVKRLVRQQVPGITGDELTLATPLGTEGLGLDSVGVVELVLACEGRFDVVLPAQLFDGHPLTLGTLVQQVANARSSCDHPTHREVSA